MARLAFSVLAVALLYMVSMAHSEPVGEIIPHHSLQQPFIHDWWQEGIPHWDVGGDAVVTEKYVRVAPAFASRWGWIWNDQNNDNQWWEVRAKLRVFSMTGIGADGLAFWYVDQPYKGPEAGPLHGMQRVFKGIGVIFDSYDNDGRRDNPAVSLITNIHGETNQWNTDSDLLSQARFRCVFDFRNTAPTDPVEMVLTYVHRKLSLRLRSELRRVDVLCGEAELDIPQDYYFGITASTGHLADNHDVYSFHLRPIGQPVGDPAIPLEHFDHKSEAQEKEKWGTNAWKGQEHVNEQQ